MLWILAGRAALDEVLELENYLLAQGSVEQSLMLRLHAEQLRHELPERPRDRDQQRGFLRWRERCPRSIGFEALGESAIESVQVGPERRVERGQSLGLEQIAETKAADSEREVALLVDRNVAFARCESETEHH